MRIRLPKHFGVVSGWDLLHALADAAVLGGLIWLSWLLIYVVGPVYGL